MEVFVNVVQAGSLSRAATHLNLANTSVTTCIRNLESHLGVTLLQRSTRHVGLTQEGAEFYASCREILGLVEAAETRAAPSGDHLQGTLRVEMPIALGHLIIGPALTDFARAHPDLRVMVNLTNGIDDLIRRGVDVAIRMDEIEDADLVARRFYTATHVLCAAPALLDRTGPPQHPADLPPGQCIGFAATLFSKPRPWTFIRGPETHTIEPAGNLFFNSSDALLRCAAQGVGFVYVLDVLARTYLDRGEIVALLPQWTTASQIFSAVYPQSRFTSPRVEHESVKNLGQAACLSRAGWPG